MQNFFKKYIIRQKSARKQIALFTFLVFFAVFFTYLFVNGLSDNAIMQKETADGKIVPLYFYKDADTKASEKSPEKDTETPLLKEKENPPSVFYNTEITDIRLKNALSGQVETLPLDVYIVGVVLAEVPASFEYEAIKAQAVAARTYAVNSITSKNSKHQNADMCTDYRCCQAYINKDAFLKKYKDSGNSAYEKIERAVSETSDIVMLYDSEVIQAFFHASSGKSTYSSKEVWGSEIEYLKPVPSVENSQTISGYVNTKTFSLKEVEKATSQTCQSQNISDFVGMPNTNTNGLVTSLRIGNNIYSGNKIREMFGLKSACFEITHSNNEKTVTFVCYGSGHGVGMSQHGANILAKEGYTYMEILKYYYTDIYFGFV